MSHVLIELRAISSMASVIAGRPVNASLHEGTRLDLSDDRHTVGTDVTNRDWTLTMDEFAERFIIPMLHAIQEAAA